MRYEARKWTALALAIPAPFAIISLYLYATRALSLGTQYDLASIMLCIAVGVAGLAVLPLNFYLRIALIPCYMGVLGLALFYYALWFVGVVFDDWL